MHKAALQHLSKDPKLKKIIETAEAPEASGIPDVYNSLLRSISAQQLSVKAAATIFGRFLDLFENRNPVPHALASKTVEDLRSVGLSNQKANYMLNIAKFALDNNFDEVDWNSLSDEQIIEFLSQIKGVGVWTVQMILMFTLNRHDVFPHADLGIQQAMQKLYGLEQTGKALVVEMNAIADNWKPYRTVACRYLWRWKDGK